MTLANEPMEQDLAAHLIAVGSVSLLVFLLVAAGLASRAASGGAAASSRQDVDG